MAAYTARMTSSSIAFIGGGNMAAALIGGLLKSGRAPESIRVIEPAAAQRERLAQQFGLAAQQAAGPMLAACEMVVWAVKPQLFAEAAAPCAAYVAGALQLSVMAGIRSETIVRASGSPRVVRAMPNTPALIGKGIAGLYAREAVSADGRSAVEQVLRPTGQLMWVAHEDDLDAVTALSGSGPAYVFYFIEAMMQAAREMGLSDAQGRQLAQATFAGAAALAEGSEEAPATLRERVTSKGGTTHAAISSLETEGVKAAFVRAILAAQRRAQELGRAS